MPERFLIVDDHPLFREALQSAIHLSFPEAAIIEATSIAGACEAAALHRDIDLVLLDLSLPGTTGFEGLLEFRSQFPRIPVVIISGLEDPRIIREAMGYGIAGFIPHTSATGINMVASIHLLAAVDNAGYFEGDVALHNPFRDEVGGTPYKLDKDGCVWPVEGPGIGINIDERFIAANPLIEGPCYV